jgi:lipopolysaccharide export system protein LptA
MRRMRWLRILVPVLFLGFLAVIVVTVRSRPPRRIVTDAASGEEGARMEGFRFSDLVGGRRRLLVEAGVGRIDEDGSFSVEDVRRAEIDREGKPPLILAAPRGQGSGKEGKRVMRLEGGVTLRDDAAGLTISIPTVEVDQVTGVVRSSGEARLTGGTWHGTASAITHSLTGQPDQIMTLVLDDGTGGHLEAQKATIDQSAGRLVLEGSVLARQEAFEVASERIVLERDAATGRLKRAEAGPGVKGRAARADQAAGRFESKTAVATWTADGQPESLTLEGAARVEQTQGSLSADRVEVRSQEAGSRALSAAGAVVVSGTLKRGPGHLTCDALSGTLDAKGDVRDGKATGNVRFSGEGTTGEAAEARFTALGPEGSIVLDSGPGQRARAANGRTRIAADTITSDLKGRRFEARGRVESTLLPDPARRASTPMFANDAAIHFVSATLTSDTSTGVLVFRGDVRGWQGDRSLSASMVEVHQEGETLDADGGVTTRLPREAGAALREGDYVQVTSERLAYRGGDQKHAAYDGSVRVRLLEGWLEAPHLEGVFGAGSGSGLTTATATGGVRFEFRARSASGGLTTATGKGDRSVFEGARRAIRLFGDSGAATIVATGEKPGSTSGRVLRYELDTGALEVESGDRDRAIIKTPTE